MIQQRWIKQTAILFSIWALSAIVDRAWISNLQPVPEWDQADYLTGAMNYWKALQTPDWFDSAWWTSLWLLSSKIPPLVYISTVPFLNLFGTSIAASTLVNLLFSGILILSVYGIGTTLFTSEVGLWAAAITLLFPGLYPHRLNYMIDHPIIAMTTLTMFTLTLWWTSGWTAAEPKPTPPPTDPPTPSTTEDAIALIRNLRQFLETTKTQKRLPLPTIQWAQIPPFLQQTLHRSLTSPWAKAIGFGIALGLAFMTKQTVALFLFTPILYALIVTIVKRHWIALLQLILGLIFTVWVAYPWYRTNWLIILTSGERATVASAIAEGDPPLNTIAAWTYYLQLLPAHVTYPLLLVAIAGLVFYSKRVVTLVPSTSQDILDKSIRQQRYQQWWRSTRWLLIFIGGAYLLCSLNVNKDLRYFTPALPIVALLLAQGLVIFPRYLWEFRWGTIALMTGLMLTNLFPIVPGMASINTDLGRKNWHQQDVINTVLQTAPHLRHTIGVLPSLPEFNQHNLNYFGTLQNFQVYGRQVGANPKQVWQDSRSLDWYVTKTGNQGAIRKPEALSSLMQQIEQPNATANATPTFQVVQAWAMPDGSNLRLYHRSKPTIALTPLQPSNPPTLQPPTNPIQLTKVTTPAIVPPNQPVPVEYQWVGPWEKLRSGLVALTWKRIEDPKPIIKSNKSENPTDNTNSNNSENQKQPTPSHPPTLSADRWLHDHGIGLGRLQSSTLAPDALVQVTETLAMLPPANASGTYVLEAIYLDRATLVSQPIALPTVKITVSPTASPTPAPELDPLTQLRLASTQLPKGLQGIDKVFNQVGQLNLYDATQDYLKQSEKLIAYRLQQESKNTQLAYTYGLTQVLQRDVKDAIAAMQRVVELDSTNPNAYAYLAFVNLYDFRGKAAQSILQPALQLNNQLPELHGLNAIAHLMQGHFIQAWQEGQGYLTRSKSSSTKNP
ncbi:phospholipid carrier-dependent glycosyltransferase [Alkalinema pantanalense CENA528]|uniref:phospholipid carrier-dependent glycosyltransferase n=1 Tax=Alkalinema pantanalense TaxID=1620705 RepID=UPI003D6FB786